MHMIYEKSPLKSLMLDFMESRNRPRQSTKNLHHTSVVRHWSNFGQISERTLLERDWRVD